MDLGQFLKTIYNLLKWELWVVLQIFNIFRWGFGFVMAHRPTPRFIVPPASRYEHTHIVAGTDHGKTQLLQKLILGDIEEVSHARGSIIVIDSQGDMIDKLMHMVEIAI
jgi:hypothetical protein